MKSVKSFNRNFWAMEYWFKALNCQYWLRNTKPFFLKNETNVETLQNFSHHIWVCHKFVLRSFKRMNRIFWAKEFRFKASKCQIWLAIKKPYFWESKANFEPFQKLFPNIWASYKFVLRSVNRLNRIFWAMEYWFTALKCQIGLTNTKPFFWKSAANFETL